MIRNWKTYYPGMLRVGYANTAVSAMEAAFRHLARGEERKATVEHRDGGGEIINMTWTPAGIVVTITRKAYKVGINRPGTPAAKKAIAIRKRIAKINRSHLKLVA